MRNILKIAGKRKYSWAISAFLIGISLFVVTEIMISCKKESDGNDKKNNLRIKNLLLINPEYHDSITYHYEYGPNNMVIYSQGNFDFDSTTYIFNTEKQITEIISFYKDAAIKSHSYYTYTTGIITGVVNYYNGQRPKDSLVFYIGENNKIDSATKYELYYGGSHYKYDYYFNWSVKNISTYVIKINNLVIGDYTIEYDNSINPFNITVLPISINNNYIDPFFLRCCNNNNTIFKSANGSILAKNTIETVNNDGYPEVMDLKILTNNLHTIIKIEYELSPE